MSCRPSQLLGISGSIRQYCLDRAVWLFGSTLDGELEKSLEGCSNDREMERSRQRVLDRWFPEQAAAPGRFKDPAALARR